MRFIKFCFLLFFIFSFSLAEEVSIGVVLGEPTGLSFKIQKDKNFVFDSGLEFNTKDNYLYLNFDFFKYDYTKITSKEITGKFPIFYGLGIKFENTKKETEIGLRFVGGIEYIFADIPLNIFIKISPTLNLIPSTSIEIAPSLGVRYILK